jgi:hypothetical protein
VIVQLSMPLVRTMLAAPPEFAFPVKKRAVIAPPLEEKSGSAGPDPAIRMKSVATRPTRAKLVHVASTEKRACGRGGRSAQPRGTGTMRTIREPDACSSSR